MHMDKCSTAYVIREMQIETSWYHYTLIGMTRIWNADHSKFWQRCGAAGTPIHCWWECKTVPSLWKTVWLFITKLNAFVPCDLAIVLLSIYWKEFKTCVVVAKSCLTLCNPLDCNKPCSPVFYYLLEFVQIHIHWVGDAINHLIQLPLSPLALHLSQHQRVF